MARFAALLRGINVGRAKRVAMADLRKLLGDLGYSDVRTLLNSGNAVFDAKSGAATAHAEAIHAGVATKLGVDAQVVVKTQAELRAALEANPLGDVATDDARLQFVFAQSRTAFSDLKAIAGARWQGERIAVGRDAVYLWCPRGVSESALALAVNKALGERGTARNAATVAKLAAMMEAP